MTDNALFESPDVRGLRLVQAALRVSVSLACWGAVATVFHQQSAPLTCTLKNVYNLAPDSCQKIENICACVLIVCGLVTLSRPLWPALLLIGIWFTAASSVRFYEDGSSLPALVPIEHAVRFLTPWALILVDFFPPRLKFGLARFLAAMVMLRLGIVASLLGTGLRAILDSRSSQGMTAVVAVVGEKLCHQPLSAETAAIATAVTGGISIGIALAMSSGRPRGIAVLAAMWSLFTAFGWTIAHGGQGYQETLLRSAEWGAPLALLMFWIRGIEDRPGRMLAE